MTHTTTPASAKVPGTLVSRRSFLIAAGGGLCLGFILPGADMALAEAPTQINGYIKIGADDIVTVMFGGLEFGQGSMTGLAQIAVEELKADWAKVKVEQADSGPISYFTGGSGAVRNRYNTLRTNGARAREMLIAAAAARLGISPGLCRAEASKVIATVGGVETVFTFGELAAEAALQPVPSSPPLTDPAAFRVIGQSKPRFDIPAKTDGSAIYGIDVRLPDMVFAAVRHAPAYGATLARTPATPAGAIAVVPLTAYDNRGAVVKGSTNAVALVASDSWKANRLLRSMSLSWNTPSTASQIDSSVFWSQAADLMVDGTPIVAQSVGDVTTELGNAARAIDVTYKVPYLAHACMEVLSCTVNCTDTACEIWAPTQTATGARNVAAAITGLPTDKVVVHTTYAGGGLGRKIESDFIAQAVQVGKALKRPVKLTWWREEDFLNDQYRPMALVRVRAGIDGSGAIAAWDYRNVSPGIQAQRAPLAPGRVDSQAVEGAIDLNYAMTARRTDWVPHPAPVPIGYWRSVGSSINAFAVECTIDELAHEAGADPFEFRRQLLAANPRLLTLLDATDAASAWRHSLPAGRGWGLAFARAFNTYVMQVAEVSVPAANTLKVHRVSCVVDCGRAVNPGQVEAQMQGGILHGMSAALWGKVTFAAGKASVRNFDTYRLARMGDAPTVDVAIVNSGEALGGIGEPGVPPIAPAIANAYFNLTGLRLRNLPFFST